jgi:hypothetical protein
MRGEINLPWSRCALVVWSLVRGVPHPSATAERAAFRDGEQEGDVVIGFLNSGARSYEETLADVAPTAGVPQGLDVSRIAQAEGFNGVDQSPRRTLARPSSRQRLAVDCRGDTRDGMWRWVSGMRHRAPGRLHRAVPLRRCVVA